MFALIVFENVVCSHAEGCCASLFKCRACKAMVETYHAVFLHNSSYTVNHRPVAAFISCVVDECSLDPFGWGHACDARHHPRHHPGAQIPQWGQGTSFRVFEVVFDRVERQEADAIFANRANDEGGAAFVQRSEAFISVDLSDHPERILRCRLTLLLP